MGVNTEMTSEKEEGAALGKDHGPAHVVLMVDDDEEDIYLTRRAFEGGGRQVDFRQVRDGAALFAYLANKGEYADAVANPRPRLILMDINMPAENGLELLRRLRGDPRYALLPVIMMSTSLSEQDVDEAYRLGANSFVAKAASAHGTKELARRIEAFWFDTVIVP